MPADVLIRGAGPVGCVLALLLQEAGKTVALEPGTRSRTALFRPLALSYASRLILERAGAWPAATPIHTVHVSRQGAFGRTRMSAEDAGVDSLGYVAQYDDLLDALLQRVSAAGIPNEAGEARLVVHAEGSSADASEKPYAQEAIVALVATEPG